LPLQLEIENKLGKEEPKKWAHHFIVKGFTALEQILEKTAGKYCFGDNVTLADIVLIPQVATSSYFQVDMSMGSHLIALSDEDDGLTFCD
jgi:glutathione S-transferase